LLDRPLRSPLVGRLPPGESGLMLLRTARRPPFLSLLLRLRVVGLDMLFNFTVENKRRLNKNSKSIDGMVHAIVVVSTIVVIIGSVLFTVFIVRCLTLS
jgi:hypothetical protein